MTTLLADGHSEFYALGEGYAGRLYLIIIPQSFPITLSKGNVLHQLRFFRGRRRFLDREELEAIHCETPLVTNTDPVFTDNGIMLHLDLTNGPPPLVSHRMGKSIELGKIGYLDPDLFFRAKPKDEYGNLFLEPYDFMLAPTKEVIEVPPHLCAEIEPHNEKHGELRIHLAGLVNPGFKAFVVCEFRNIGQIPQILTDGRAIGAIRFERLTGIPDALYGTESAEKRPNSYQQQTSLLPKMFRAT